MTLDQQQVVSAQVVLRSATGRVPDGGAVITADTLAEFVPSAEDASAAARAYAAAGFEVGPLVGNSFTITAPVATFERVFKTRLRPDGQGGVVAVGDGGQPSYELPVQNLSPALADGVYAVTFSRPPDFGPTNPG